MKKSVWFVLAAIVFPLGGVYAEANYMRVSADAEVRVKPDRAVITFGLSEKTANLRDGAASSVNMQTLVYQSWALHGDLVVLTGQSVGNGQTIDFAENFTLRKEGGEWTLQAQDGSVVYRRNK